MHDPQGIRQASHDLRNNLHVIEMALTILEHEEDPDQLKRTFDAVKSELVQAKRNLEGFIGLVQPERK